MHGKEAVIAPLFEKSFGVDCITPNTFDTDFFGTFTGEIERTLTPLETVRLKCKEAMDQHNIDLGIANEGSFGAHPSLHFIPADEEWMILIDRKNDLEIIVKHISTKTNFSGKYIQSIEALEEFAKLIGFPEHALILRKEEGSKEYIHKGIKDWNTLKQLYTEIEKAFGGAFVETDMRAMNNPLRMKVIQETTEKLIAKIHLYWIAQVISILFSVLLALAYFKDFINNYLYNPFVNGTYPVYDSYPEAEKAMSLAIKKYKKSKLK